MYIGLFFFLKHIWSKATSSFIILRNNAIFKLKNKTKNEIFGLIFFPYETVKDFPNV